MSGLRNLVASGLRDLQVRDYPVAADARPDGRGPYPLFWDHLPHGTRLDATGVVQAARPDGGWYPNPVSMCLYALGRHNRVVAARRPEPRADGPLLTQAAWLRAQQDGAGGWRYPVPAPRYGVAAGWYSGMAQGMAASVLLRAADLTGERSYLDAADGAVDLLLRPVSAGGCAHYDGTGRPFLEECPAEPPNHILNGAVFALFGLIEHQHRRGGSAHLAAEARLAEELPGFDLGYWSRYDLRWPWPATVNYHALHVSLLSALGRLTATPAFTDLSARWARALRNPRHRMRARLVKATGIWRHHRG
ncbi:D-glucuronyl C5-epimerase family protein [Micromonospora sp. NPDC004551]|uniref:D-glucuronyl C5-epimerase family protein n=1 Tax=Micromonospora sp. NPDC004551 TaxID=3154284 RepID=UPI0033A41F65